MKVSPPLAIFVYNSSCNVDQTTKFVIETYLTMIKRMAYAAYWISVKGGLTFTRSIFIIIIVLLRWLNIFMQCLGENAKSVSFPCVSNDFPRLILRLDLPFTMNRFTAKFGGTTYSNTTGIIGFCSPKGFWNLCFAQLKWNSLQQKY